MAVSNCRSRFAFAFVFALSLLRASAADADSLTLMWDPNVETVAGYAVYVGSSRVDVGHVTSHTMNNITPGQQYCFAVAAYTAAVEGPKSSQVCGYSNQFPVLNSPGNQSGTAGQADTLQLVGSDPDGQPVSYMATGLPPGLAVGTATGFISGTPTTAGTYTVTATVFDGVLTSVARTFTWTVAAAPTADTTAPSVSITSPSAGSTFTSTTASVQFSGTSSDNVGVTWVGWANSAGGSGVALGTINWNFGPITLSTGANVITVTARDGAGNVATDVLTVTYTPPDTTNPTITISSPTTSATFTATSSSLPLGGSASDNVGVTQVTWSNDRGGAGTASGTANWSVAGITLQSGTNVITVTARDAASNTNTDVLTVTYTPPDTNAPAVSILGPTSSSSYTTTSPDLTMGGSSSDDRGVTSVTWANNRGGTGFTSGTTNWSVARVVLSAGTNVITVTAEDAAGNRGTDMLTVTYNVPDTTLPSVSITGPTPNDTFAAASSPISLSGSAADNVGVTQVMWSVNGSAPTLASGTGSWSVPSVPLQVGTNVITIVATDAAGNLASDVLTVSYAVTLPPPPPPSSLDLTGRVYSSGKWRKVQLRWSMVSGPSVDVYLNGARIITTANDGSHVDSPRITGPFSYQVCVTGTALCSNTLVLNP